MLNNREISIAIWALLLFGFALWKARPWSSLKALAKALFAKPMRSVLILMAIYIFCCVWLLERLHVWTWSNMKATLLWSGGFALVTMFRIDAVERETERVFFRKLVRESIGVNFAVAFVASAYTFSLPVELLLTPTTTLLALILVVAQRDEKNSNVASLVSNLLTIVGITVFGYAIYQTLLNFSSFATGQNAREFAVPFFLTLMFLPFLYGLHIFMVYERAFGRIRRSIKDPVARDYARRRLIFAFMLDVDGLKKWLRHVGLFNVTSESDVEASIVEIKSVRRLERRPYRVPPLIGWPPEKARKFLSDHGLTAGDYYRSYDGWCANSPYLKLGPSVLDNNVAYYIEGTQYAALRLTLVLNVNEPVEAECAEAQFERIASILVSKAVYRVGAVDQQVSLVAGSAPTIVYGKRIELQKEEWIGGIDGGYELRLAVTAES